VEGVPGKTQARKLEPTTTYRLGVDIRERLEGKELREARGDKW
jgi:hypothetical protein